MNSRILYDAGIAFRTDGLVAFGHVEAAREFDRERQRFSLGFSRVRVYRPLLLYIDLYLVQSPLLLDDALDDITQDLPSTIIIQNVLIALLP